MLLLRGLRLSGRWVALALLACGLNGPAMAQDDGPRAYMLAPDSVHLLSVYGLFIRGNQAPDPGMVFRGADVDIDLSLLQYTHPLAVAGNAAAAFVVVPVGSVSGDIGLGPVTLSDRSGGLGDIQVGAVLGLIGSPSLSPGEYATYKPGFSLGVLGKVIAPTGTYSQDKIFNLGANRWSFKLGAPLTYYLGASLLDPSLTTFELLPSATFFTANDAPFGADRVEQDPLLTLEGHVTRNLGSRLWVSADLLYSYGGETRTDGVSDQNRRRSLALGGTLGVNLPSRLMLKLTYGQSISHSADGADGTMVRAILSRSF